MRNPLIRYPSVVQLVFHGKRAATRMATWSLVVFDATYRLYRRVTCTFFVRPGKPACTVYVRSGPSYFCAA